MSVNKWEQSRFLLVGKCERTATVGDKVQIVTAEGRSSIQHIVSLISAAYLAYLTVKVSYVKFKTEEWRSQFNGAEGGINMKIPLQVTFRNMEHSAVIEANINEKAAKLERFYDRIMGCRVVVEATQRRHHQGNLYSVRIDITVPGKELAVNRQENEDAYVAIRDAFDAAVRLLEEHNRQLRGVVKTHAEPPKGRIVRIFPEADYGFIKTPDEREIYFHKNSVLNEIDFNNLKFGTEVTFIEEQGAEGPQAARVAINRR
jgi:ribosomal subunit interface protein